MLYESVKTNESGVKTKYLNQIVNLFKLALIINVENPSTKGYNT